MCVPLTPCCAPSHDPVQGTRHSEWPHVLSCHCTSQCGLPDVFELSVVKTAVYSCASKVIREGDMYLQLPLL